MFYQTKFCRILVLVLSSFLIWLVKVKAVSATDIPIAQINPDNLNLGKQMYLENCGSCHIALPPQVLPTDSWQKILNNSRNHYGESLPRINNLTTRLMWNYLKFSSRPSLTGETIPEYITNSRYLKALHPQIDLPKPTTHQSCSSCHLGTAQLDYRTLSDDWESSN